MESKENAVPQERMEEMERLWTQAEVAEYLRVDLSTIWKWRRQGKLTGLKTPGGQLRFRERDVLKALEEEAVPA